MLIFFAGDRLRAAEGGGTNSPGSPNPEKELCTKNLQRVYDAIQAYRADRQEYPDWLSDLVPKYIEDVNILSCPITRRTGRVDTQGPTDPKMAISYSYQYGNQPIPAAFSGGSRRTMREWKTRQLAVVGDIVPLVRCRLHSPQLNVSFGGQIYESPQGWEITMTNRVNPSDLSVQKLFPEDAQRASSQAGAPIQTNRSRGPENPAPVILRIPARDPQAPSALIDLTDYYNAGLNEPWLARPNSGYRHSDLSWLPRGIQTFTEVDFDVRGVIQIAGRGLASNRFPPAVKNIRLNRKCHALHFLHATGWSVADGTSIGQFRVVYADGENREIPIVYGVNVRDWTQPVGKTEPEAPGLTLAWSGKSPLSQSQGTTLRLYKTSWENPLPQTRVDTLDFVSAMTNCAPFLIAITAE